MIAIRPPEYWPRLEYLALIASVDRFVLADTFQYSRQSYQNRARLRTPQGSHWISIPLVGGQHGRPIHSILMDYREPWPRKHWRSLEFNYRSTPFFEFYEEDLSEIFEQEWPSLADLTCATVQLSCRLLEIPTEIVRASALPGSPADLRGIMEAAGDGELATLAESQAHDERLVPDLRVFEYREQARRQNFEGFVPGISALDVLFNLGPTARGEVRG